MNIIVGATGQVGSHLISEIKKSGFPVRAVVRNIDKLEDKTLDAREADLFNADQLTEAFKGGTTVFLLTPENPASNDIIGETKEVVENYYTAIKNAGIKRIVGLSCIGAHVDGNTGNILMSRILEQGFNGLDVEKIFIRPSYYFSNWLGFLDTMQEPGVLPTFFPEDLKIQMNSPVDLAKFIAKVMVGGEAPENTLIYELTGQQTYSSVDVANTFSELLGKKITAQSIPREKWHETLVSAGFTQNTAANLSDMTQTVINHKAIPERPTEVIKLPTTLEEYLQTQLKG